MKSKNILWMLLLAGLFQACSDTDTKQKEEDKPEATGTQSTVKVPSFNADSAYSYIQKQVDFGPRVPNGPSHTQCGNYLEARLKSLGIEVTVQQFEAKAYTGKKLDLKNIIGSYNPKATKRLLFAAHWDSRPFADQDSSNQKKPIDGANDGASGVGILIELIRSIEAAGEKPNVGVDVIFFDGEDYGQPDFDTSYGEVKDSWCLGSQYWSKNKHKANYAAYYGILLDMVGAKNAKFAMEGTSMHYAPIIVEKVWKNAERIGFGQFFIFQESSPIIDDHSYVNQLAKIPMIDIIEYNVQGPNYFGNYWHTHNDDMDVIDRSTLQAVGQTLLETIYQEK